MIIPDGLGFGSSLHIGMTFRLEDQIDAVLHLLDRHEFREVYVGAHRWVLCRRRRTGRALS